LKILHPNKIPGRKQNIPPELAQTANRADEISFCSIAALTNNLVKGTSKREEGK